MGTLDGPMGAVARSLTRSLGGSGTYIRPGSGGSYNTATGNIEGAAAETSTSVSVAPGSAAIRMFDGAMVKQGDVTVIVSRLEVGAEPNPGGDKLTWKGVTWRVVAVEPYGSGDQDAAYALLLRR